MPGSIGRPTYSSSGYGSAAFTSVGKCYTPLADHLFTVKHWACSMTCLFNTANHLPRIIDRNKCSITVGRLNKIFAKRSHVQNIGEIVDKTLSVNSLLWVKHWNSSADAVKNLAKTLGCSIKSHWWMKDLDEFLKCTILHGLGFTSNEPFLGFHGRWVIWSNKQNQLHLSQ